MAVNRGYQATQQKPNIILDVAFISALKVSTAKQGLGF